MNVTDDENRAGRSRRDNPSNNTNDYYTEDDLQFILLEPVVVDGVIRVAIALDKPGPFIHVNSGGSGNFDACFRLVTVTGTLSKGDAAASLPESATARKGEYR